MKVELGTIRAKLPILLAMTTMGVGGHDPLKGYYKEYYKGPFKGLYKGLGFRFLGVSENRGA